MERRIIEFMLVLLVAALAEIARADAEDMLVTASSELAAGETSALPTTTQVTTSAIAETTTIDKDDEIKMLEARIESLETKVQDHAGKLDLLAAVTPAAVAPAETAVAAAAAAPAASTNETACEECIDKVVLVVLESVGLGVLGIDRYYAGHYTTGTLKLLTLGGCGVWAIVDWLTVMINAVERKESMSVIKAKFSKEGLGTARTVAFISIAIVAWGCCCCCLSCCFQISLSSAAYGITKTRGFASLAGRRASRDLSAPMDDLFAEDDVLHHGNLH